MFPFLTKLLPKNTAPTKQTDAIIRWNTFKLLPDIRSLSGNNLEQSNVWKFKETPSVSLDRGLLSSVFGHWVFTAVFTSSMPRSNCPQMLFKCNLPDVKAAKCWPWLQWQFVFWRGSQRNILTLIGSLYWTYTEISVFKKYHRNIQNSPACWSDRHGVIIMLQTFGACTHGLPDRGKQSTMGSDSCIYQHI